MDGHFEVIKDVVLVASEHPGEVAHRGEPRMSRPPETFRSRVALDPGEEPLVDPLSAEYCFNVSPMVRANNRNAMTRQKNGE